MGEQYTRPPANKNNIKQEPSDNKDRIIKNRIDKSLFPLQKNAHEEMDIIGEIIIKTIGKIRSLEVKHSGACSTSLNKAPKVNKTNPEIPEMIINHLRSESILVLPFSAIVLHCLGTQSRLIP